MLNLRHSFCLSAILIVLIVLVASEVHSPYPIQDSQYSGSSVRTENFLFLGTKTPYRYAVNESSSELAPIEGCKPIHLNLLSRHGSRYPTSHIISGLTRLEIWVQLHKSDPNLNPKFRCWMMSWVNPYASDVAGMLHPRGFYEQYQLGKRIASAWKKIFDPSSLVTPKQTFHIRYTSSQRTLDSACSFKKGLLEIVSDLFPGSSFDVEESSSPKHEDRLLRPFDNCPSFSSFLENSNHAIEYYNILSEKISKLLHIEVEPVHVKLMHHACIFELVTETESPWCKLFTGRDMMILDYEMDLLNFCDWGKGCTNYYEMTTNLLRNFVHYIEKIINIEEDSRRNNLSTESYDTFPEGNDNISTSLFRDHPNVEQIPVTLNLHFAHSETIIPFLTLLGLFNLPPQISNYNDSNVFNSRSISSFSANIGLITYDCQSSGDEGERYRVGLLLNEKPIAIGSCSHSGSLLCGFDEFKRIYKKELTVDYDKLCKI